MVRVTVLALVPVTVCVLGREPLRLHDNGGPGDGGPLLAGHRLAVLVAQAPQHQVVRVLGHVGGLEGGHSLLAEPLDLGYDGLALGPLVAQFLGQVRQRLPSPAADQPGHGVRVVLNSA